MQNNYKFHLTVTKKNTALVLLKTTLCNKRQMTQYSQKSLQVRPDLPSMPSCTSCMSLAIKIHSISMFGIGGTQMANSTDHHNEKSKGMKSGGFGGHKTGLS